MTESTTPEAPTAPETNGTSTRKKILIGAGGIILALAALSAVTPSRNPTPLVIPSAEASAKPAVQSAPESTAAPAGPQYTVAQQNAIESAQSYLAFAGFSRSGLIEQLEFEKYSKADATLAVDSLGADWKAEAAESAKSYLNLTSFSRSGLIEQLEFEGFTHAESVYGVTQAGL